MLQVDIVFRSAAELDHLHVLRAFDLPWVAIAHPVVRVLDLIAVIDMLLEHSVFVAQPIAGHRQPERRAAVEKTGRQAPQTAVTEARVRLGVLDLLEADGEVFDRLVDGLAQVQVEQMIAQRSANEVLQRQVMRAPDTHPFVQAPGVAPVAHDTVADRVGQRFVQIETIATEETTEVILEIAPDVLAEVLRCRRQCGHIR